MKFVAIVSNLYLTVPGVLQKVQMMLEVLEVLELVRCSYVLLVTLMILIVDLGVKQLVLIELG